MSIQLDQIVFQNLLRWKKSPELFFIEALGIKPEYIWFKMREVMESVRDNKHTAVKAGHSVSKSFCAGRLALWFLYTHYPSTVITTAPSHSQVEQILWREIRDAHANAVIPLGGEPGQTKLELGEKWFAYGFSTKPDTVTQEATRVQGYHNKHVLVILDEAAGIMKPIWEAIDSLLAAEGTKILAIGNPTVATGNFIECFKDRDYKKITISVLDTPNYKEGREVIPGISGRGYVEKTYRKYGKNSNYAKARVRGEVPDEDVDALISLRWIEEAHRRHRENQRYPYNFEKKFLTWDVADGGDDSHVIKAWENKFEIGQKRFQGKKIEEVEPEVWRFLRDIGGNAVIIDADGVGRVAVKLMQAAADERTQIVSFSGGSKEVKDPEDFEYRYSEGHWAMRQDFKNGEIAISEDPDQTEELSKIKIILHRKGMITVEPKKDLKKLLGRSPDYKDAIMMMSACFDDIDPVHSRKDPYVFDDEYEHRLDPNLV